MRQKVYPLSLLSRRGSQPGADRLAVLSEGNCSSLSFAEGGEEQSQLQLAKYN